MSQWSEVSALDVREGASGVYAIFDREGLLYIGETSSLAQRIKAQQRVFGRNGAVMFRVRLCSTTVERKRRERQLIRRLRPRANRKVDDPRKTSLSWELVRVIARDGPFNGMSFDVEMREFWRDGYTVLEYKPPDGGAVQAAYDCFFDGEIPVAQWYPY